MSKLDTAKVARDFWALFLSGHCICVCVCVCVCVDFTGVSYDAHTLRHIKNVILIVPFVAF